MNTALSRLLPRALGNAGFVLAAILATLSPIMTPPAEASAAEWSAKLSAPLPAPRQAIVNSVLWKCAGDTCVAPDQGSRPVLVCRSVSRAFGPVARFASSSGELAAEDLSRCAGK
ncbi:MAG: hypothetical protein ABI673_11200 [Novosphingobium sp.]